MFNVLFFLHSPSFPGNVRHRCTVAHAEKQGSSLAPQLQTFSALYVHLSFI